MYGLRARKSVAWLLSTVLVFGSLFSSVAQAGVVTTSDLLAEQQASEQISLKGLLARDDVRQQLLELGVSPEDVDARVEAMSAEELGQVNAQLQDMPAGAGVLGVVLTIFIVFVITDVIGATDIFPFIRPVN